MTARASDIADTLPFWKGGRTMYETYLRIEAKIVEQMGGAFEEE